jgi:hypothetical protein
MRRTSAVALKEWAVICRALGAGSQILLLRKGGIRDASQGFRVEHREFFLFPTYVHEAADELVDRARPTLAEVDREAPPGGELRLELYAAVEAVAEITSLEPLRRLAGQHALAWTAVERRFHYRRPGLHVLALRVHRLARPVVTPHLFRYDGCRSWVTLEAELPVDGARPVLDDRAFAEKLAAVHASLAAEQPTPPPRQPA